MRNVAFLLLATSFDVSYIESMKTIAIVGATGLVGRKMIDVILERNIKSRLMLFASERSAGKIVQAGGKSFAVKALSEEAVKAAKCDYALFAVSGELSKKWAGVFAASGCIVVDNSSAFRLDTDVPLVVSEVNGEAAARHKGIVANPNCTTIACALPLKALDDEFVLKRVTFTTYQAVSGAGSDGIAELESGGAKRAFAHPIINNVIPFISGEEEKMANETRKILGRAEIEICATCVRVPVRNGHSISVVAECEKEVSAEQAEDVLRRAEGVVLCDLPMPLLADGRDEVFVGRVRQAFGSKNALAFFVASDNVRKGAATNAVQIVEFLIEAEKNANRRK